MWIVLVTIRIENLLYCLSKVLLMLQALGAVSENLSPFLLSVIQLSTDVHQACHVYLLEDGLELWLAVLENSSSMSYDLLQLFRNMPPLLGRFLKCNRSLLLSSHHFVSFVLASLPLRILFVQALVRVLYDTWILWNYNMQSFCHVSCIIIYFNSIFVLVSETWNYHEWAGRIIFWNKL